MALVALAAGWSAFVFYHHAALQHPSVGHFSGNIVPGRFLMGGYAICFFVPLLAGAVLLALDHRRRDRSAGALDALESRPVSNLAFFVGRLLALTGALWLVCAAFVVLMQGAGLIADRWLRSDAVEGWLGPVEPWSAAAFLFVDAPPAAALWSAMLLFLAAALRNRGAVAVVALAALGGYAWCLLDAPLRLLPAISVLSGLDGFASDMLPRFVTGEGAAQRAMQLAMTAGLVGLGAALYPRADQGNLRNAAVGALTLAAGAAGIAVLARSALAGEELRAEWLAAHAAQRGALAADLVRLSADVSIDPGRDLKVDASLAVALPAEPVAELVFALNPGMQVEEAWLDGEAASFTHENGLLRVAADSGRTGADATLRVVATGVPDARFAYLDAIVDPLSLGVADGHYRILGNEPMAFSARYAVLLPGLKWLPAPGPNLARDAPDFHDVDLRLDLPADWRAAAPGVREEAAEAGRLRVRFRTESPVPETGLVAGRFDRYATTVGEVEMELLLHPGHRRNAEFFAPDARALLNQSLGLPLTYAKQQGLEYPHRRFTAVEVPGRLRGFGGGWRLDATLSLPGVALLREYGLPATRMTMPPTLMVMFVMSADNSGGDPSIALWRTLTRYQAAAAGQYAPILDFVMDYMAKQAMFGHWAGFFSAHHFDAAGQAGPAVDVLDRLMGHGVAVDHELSAAAGRVAISEAFLNNALGELRFADDPEQALDMLHFKGSMLARMLSHGWPSGGAAKLVREVISRHRGSTYMLDDLRAAGAAVGAPLDAGVGEWWSTALLPGFVTSPLEAHRLPDAADGAARYQTRLHVCNEEPVPGLVRLNAYGSADSARTFSIHPVAANACVEIGAVTAFPPTRVKLGTYLSRNAGGIAFPPLAVVADAIVDAPPFKGARESAWRPDAAAGLVVDDLSPEFALDDEAERRWLRLGRPPAWRRQETAGSWGRYARTAVWSEPGAGDRAATLSAQLPAIGRWRLDYHLPGAQVAELEGSVSMLARRAGAVRQLGAYDIALVEHGDGGGVRRTEIEFDAGIAEAGWNHLGNFDLTSRDVSVVVTDRTDGEVVIADAIRWRPMEAGTASLAGDGP